MTTKTIMAITAALVLSTASVALADGAGNPQHSDRYLAEPAARGLIEGRNVGRILPQASAPRLIEGRNVAIVRVAPMTGRGSGLSATTREAVSVGYSGF